MNHPHTTDALRRLDAEIAIACFGWRWYTHIQFNFCVLWPPAVESPGAHWVRYNDGLWMRESTPEEIGGYGMPGTIPPAGGWDDCAAQVDERGCLLRPRLPYYSSRAEAAMEVVRWLTGDAGVELSMHYMPDKIPGNAEWTVSAVLPPRAWQNLNPAARQVSSTTDNLPRAVCDIALRVAAILATAHTSRCDGVCCKDDKPWQAAHEQSCSRPA